jgi:hypothetical protein
MHQFANPRRCPLNNDEEADDDQKDLKSVHSHPTVWRRRSQNLAQIELPGLPKKDHTTTRGVRVKKVNKWLTKAPRT